MWGDGATRMGVQIVRVAPKQFFAGLRFDVWMALAKATPLISDEDSVQSSLQRDHLTLSFAEMSWLGNAISVQNFVGIHPVDYRSNT